MIEMGWILDCIRDRDYRYSRHADRERQNDSLAIEEIEQSILTGRIIEWYSDTGRGESCLVAGFTNTGKPVHTVCGCSGSALVIVTVYVPTPPQFKNPFERSRT